MKHLAALQSLRTLPIMKKRARPKTPEISFSNISSVPSTPPTPQTLKKLQPNNTKSSNNNIFCSINKTKRSLTTNPSPTTAKSSFNQTQKWVPLNLGKSELFLPLTFPTGQTFRWKQTGAFQFTGVVGSHLISLKQLDNGSGDVAYFVHETCDEGKAKEALLDYLNIGISLVEMWEVFSASDSRFADLALHLGGARVLRQDPLECLIQFLCSSNNNIGRITKMVDFVSSLGDYLGTVEGLDFHEFPSLERLLMVSEEEFRDAGFGYRAKYIVGTVNALQLRPCGGAEWLVSLRDLDLHDAIEALSTLPGVGPKVAACIALFSLDQHQAIPVDTHVWQIAIRYLTPELAGVRFTPKLHNQVAEAFVKKFGKYAGWAQTVLFIAELPSQKALLPSPCGNVKKTKSVRMKDSGTRFIDGSFVSRESRRKSSAKSATTRSIGKGSSSNHGLDFQLYGSRD